MQSAYMWWRMSTYDKDVRSCFLRTFLDRSSQFLHHISFLLVNLDFTMPIKLYWNKKIAIKYNIINIRWGTMFCSGRFFRRKFIIFLFWCVNSIIHLVPIFPCRLHKGLLCYGDPKLSVKSTFMNSMAILWQIWRIYCECFEKKIATILAWI